MNGCNTYIIQQIAMVEYCVEKCGTLKSYNCITMLNIVL